MERHNEVPKFDAYSQTELAAIGESFVEVFRPALSKQLATETWTENVLDWFAATANAQATVDARASRNHCEDLFSGRRQRATKGEFLFDLVHSSWPNYEHWGSREYWSKAIVASVPELFLVMESEWGNPRNADANLHAVMEDAAKLVHVRARVKVVLFASVSVDNSLDIAVLLEGLARADKAGVTAWLFVDMPWHGTPKHWVCAPT